MSDWMLAIFLVIIAIIGGLILFVVTYGKGLGRSVLDVDKYRKRWLAIEHSVEKNNESSQHMAILNADKLLGFALQQRGFSGQTMAERMKSASKNLSKENDVWHAHKLRNKIAHEPSVQVDYGSTRRAMAAYKQALKDMGAI